MTSPTSRVTVALDAERLAALRQAAADAGGSPGLVARALIHYGLDHIDDPEVIAAVAEGIGADRDRRRAVGSEVMRKRWAEKEKE